MTRPAFTDDVLDSLRQRGDPVADQVVGDFIQARGVVEPRELVQLLIREREALPEREQLQSVRDYFDQPVPLPTWAEAALLREGQEFFAVFGVHIASALFCASLPMSYAAVDGSQVLTRTAELVSHTRRRLAQTGQMLLDVMGANDDHDATPFAPGTPSYRAPHGVRLFHAAVRRMLRADRNYDPAKLGEPINQEDLLGTLISFTVVVIDSLERFGIRVEARQRDAYVRLWLTAGFLLGIEPDLLLTRNGSGDEPLDWDELCALRDLIARRHAGPSTSGRILMAALLAEETEPLPFFLRGLPRACTRHLIGEPYIGYLAIPPAPLASVLLRPLPLVNSLLFRRRYYDLTGWLFARVTRDMYRSWIAASDPGDAGQHPWRYEPIERAWKLEPVRTRATRVARHPIEVTRGRRAAGTAFSAR